MAVILATEDIPEEVLTRLALDVRDLVPVERTDRWIFRSMEGPSWLRVVADALTWEAALKAAVMAFVVALGGRAGRDVWEAVWRNKGRVGAALQHAAVAPLRRMVSALRATKQRCQSSTRVVLCLPVPDEHWGTQLTLPMTSEDDDALAIAVFVDRMSEVQVIIRREADRGRCLMGPVELQVQPGGVLLVRWQDRVTRETKEQRVGEQLHVNPDENKQETS